LIPESKGIILTSWRYRCDIGSLLRFLGRLPSRTSQPGSSEYETQLAIRRSLSRACRRYRLASLFCSAVTMIIDGMTTVAVLKSERANECFRVEAILTRLRCFRHSLSMSVRAPRVCAAENILPIHLGHAFCAINSPQSVHRLYKHS
jgi:hypothetical protein